MCTRSAAECGEGYDRDVVGVLDDRRCEYPTHTLINVNVCSTVCCVLEKIDYLGSTYGSLFNIFLSSLYHAMDAIPGLKVSDIAPYVGVLEQIRDSGLVERTDIDIPARMVDIQERIRQVAAQWHETKMRELQAAPGVNRALPLLLMTDEIEKAAKLLDKRFPEPVFE